ncbi:MAG: arsenate reductase ArsC [Thiohalorhabdaceae bacterium]
MNILFLCTGNSCRSQMAEGWGRHLGGPGLHFDSAGIEAHGQNPRAIAVMDEVGVDISGQASTRLDDGLLAWADRVITVCGHADEHCPILPPETTKEHWPLSDSAGPGTASAAASRSWCTGWAQARRARSGLGPRPYPPRQRPLG